MVNRFEDLAPLVAPSGVARGSTVGFRQGVVESWDPLTATGTVRIGGTPFSDLPTLASGTEVLLIKPGDVVSILVVSGNAAFSTMYILGRITQPNTPQAASFMELFGFARHEVTASATISSTTYGDLPGSPGPQVTNVQIGKSGRCLIFLTCQFNYAPDQPRGGQMAYEITGATNVAPTSARVSVVSLFNSLNDTGNVLDMKSVIGIQDGLNPGLHTFTAKYRLVTGSGLVTFSSRAITVQPL